MTKNKLNVRQVCLLFITFSIAIKIITLPSIVAGISNEGMWISVLLNFIIDGAMILYILKMSEKFKGLTFFQILEVNLGSVPAKIVTFAYFIYFILYLCFIFVNYSPKQIPIFCAVLNKS